MPKGIFGENRLYLVELALRPGSSWEAVLPANMASLKGMLSSNLHWKQKREALMQQFGVNQAFSLVQATERALNAMVAEAAELLEEKRQELQSLNEDLQARRENASNAFDAMVERAASGILEQLTADGKDSLIPSDMRFKRTRGKQGRNLYIGAGDILTALIEAAFFATDDAGLKRRLGNRLYLSPGKVVLYRFDHTGKTRLFLQKADGRRERHVPPGEPDPRMNFRRKPATINYPEVVNYPALLHFGLWMTPDVNPDDILRYLTIAGELGLYGYHSYRQGQFEVVKYHEAPDDYKSDMVLRNVQKAHAEAMTIQQEVEV